MFEYADFVLRNPAYALKNWRAQSEVRRNMLEYRRLNQSCEWCGRTKRLDVHHRISVALNPYKAHLQSNMAMLCHKGCHLVVGHNRDYARRLEGDLSGVVSSSKVIRIGKAAKESVSG